ncbi:MAG: hypothetical protein H8D82_02090 [Euryarchaeota archaeon]|nr:hypothetical protein [Euryarchaeota archaeon]
MIDYTHLVGSMGDGEKISLREYWQSASEKISAASLIADDKLKVAKEKTGEVASKAAEKTAAAASAAAEKSNELTTKIKDAVHERRTRPNPKLADLEPMHGVISPEPILPPLEQMAKNEGKVAIPTQDYEEMCVAVTRLQESEARTAELVEKIISLESLNEEVHVEKRKGRWSLVSRRGEVRELSNNPVSKPPEKLTHEVGKSLQETTTILGVSVLWLAGLTGLSYLSENGGLPIPELPVATDLALWSVGTGAWSLFVLWRLRKARTILSMPLALRVQTAIGVGLVTAMTIILMQEQQTALQNVWGWSATVALTAVLLSGFIRGTWGSLRRLGRIGKSRPEVIDVE